MEKKKQERKELNGSNKFIPFFINMCGVDLRLWDKSGNK